MDPRRLRRPGGRRRDPRARRPGSRRCRDGLAELHHVWSIEGDGIGVLTPLGADVTDERARGASYDGGAGRPRHADLHLRHDRAAQGLHAHPRQLHVRARPSPSTSSTSCSPRPASTARAPRRCCSCRWPTSSRGSSRSGCVKARVRMGHSADIKNLLDDFAAFRADLHPGRPAGLREGVQHRLASAPSPTAGARSSTGPPTWRSPGRAGLESGQAQPRRSAPSTGSSTGWSTPGCATALGGRCAYAVSGGAPLGERLGHFYRGIGVNVLEGYGLTETTAALTANLPDAQKIGTVGRPLPGTAVRVADDGELLFRGGQVFAGYWQRRGGHRRGQGRPTAGSTPATSARSTTRASSGSPAARRRSW